MMCDGCWRDHGSPTHTSPRILAAADLIRRLYLLAPTGGPLHAVVDDWNLAGLIDVTNRSDFDPVVLLIADELAALLNTMPVRDRAAALARYEGFIREATDAAA